MYPLLGAKKNGWTFLASEVDSMNFTYAQRNIEKNGLQDKIKGLYFQMPVFAGVHCSISKFFVENISVTFHVLYM